MNVRRMLVLLMFALGAAALGASSSAQGAILGGTWMSTSTQALNLNGQLLGPAPAGEQLEISAVLPLRNSSSIASAIESGTILTPDQVAATYGPPPRPV